MGSVIIAGENYKGPNYKNCFFNPETFAIIFTFRFWIQSTFQQGQQNKLHFFSQIPLSPAHKPLHISWMHDARNYYSLLLTNYWGWKGNLQNVSLKTTLHFSVYQELISQSSHLNRVLFNPTKVKKKYANQSQQRAVLKWKKYPPATN